MCNLLSVFIFVIVKKINSLKYLLRTTVAEKESLFAKYSVQRCVVKAVRGIQMRECANLYKSMKNGTLVIFDMLCPNLLGAKANSQWCRHIRQFCDF